MDARSSPACPPARWFELEDVLERVSDGILAMDAGRRIVYVNGAAERWLKRSRAALLGLNVFDAFPDLRVVGEFALDTLHQAESPVTFESVHAPSGRSFHHTLFPSRDGGA